MNKIFIILTFFLIGCKNNNDDTCIPSLKVINGELRSTLFSFQNEFIIYRNNNTPQCIIGLRKKYSCFSRLTPKYYASKNDYTVIVFNENNKNGVIIILNNKIERLIKISNFKDYQFQGISLEDETLSIFLIYKKMKQRINFRTKNDYVFWNNYEF